MFGGKMKSVVCRSVYKTLVIGRLWTSILAVYLMVDNKLSFKIHTVENTVKQLCIPGRLPHREKVSNHRRPD